MSALSKSRAWMAGAGLMLVLPLVGLSRESAQVAEIPEDTLPRPLPRAVPLGLPDTIAELLPSAAVADLGRRLFFDPILSRDRSIACASCHDPAHGFADPKASSLGIDAQPTARNTPTLFNRVLGTSFFWDGRAATLEEQVLVPIANEAEMALPIETAVERLGESYGAAFRQVFGGSPNEERLSRALAGFVRMLLRGDSAVDRFRAGEVSALTPEERGGLWLFESRAGCWHCHDGANLSDEGFHATGVGSRHEVPEEGRGAITGEEEDRGRFKTPTLRGISLTAPYMHDGSLETIEDVLTFYSEGGRASEGLDPHLKQLDLSERDKARLAAFLRRL